MSPFPPFAQATQTPKDDFSSSIPGLVEASIPLLFW